MEGEQLSSWISLVGFDWLFSKFVCWFLFRLLLFCRLWMYMCTKVRVQGKDSPDHTCKILWIYGSAWIPSVDHQRAHYFWEKITDTDWNAAHERLSNENTEHDNIYRKFWQYWLYVISTLRSWMVRSGSGWIWGRGWVQHWRPCGLREETKTLDTIMHEKILVVWSRVQSWWIKMWVFVTLFTFRFIHLTFTFDSIVEKRHRRQKRPNFFYRLEKVWGSKVRSVDFCFATRNWVSKK